MKLQETLNNNRNKLPWVALLTSLLAMLVYCGNAADLLQYDRAAIGKGQVWRLTTGHWTHWSLDHLLWCSLTFVALGVVCEPSSRRGFLATIAASSLAIPLIVWVAEPGMSLYRGLSGIASAVFVFGVVLMVLKSHATKDRFGFYLAALAGIFYFGKLLFEFITGHTLFVHAHGLFIPAPLVHMVGGGVGLLMAVFFAPRRGMKTS